MYIKALLEHYTKISWLRKDPQATRTRGECPEVLSECQLPGQHDSEDPPRFLLIKTDEMHQMFHILCPIGRVMVTRVQSAPK